MSNNIKYCSECGREISSNAVVCPNCGVQLKPLQAAGSGRNRFVAAILAFLLGGFGIQWFYLGKTMYGVLSILFCWTFIPSIITYNQNGGSGVSPASNGVAFNAKYNNW